MIEFKLKPSNETAIDIAVQTTKLLITLATSILAFTITFIEKIKLFIGSGWVKFTWFLLGISITAGIVILAKIVGELATNEKVYLYSCLIKKACMVQIMSFGTAIVLLAALSIYYL